jgi:hypothetical protein
MRDEDFFVGQNYSFGVNRGKILRILSLKKRHYLPHLWPMKMKKSGKNRWPETLSRGKIITAAEKIGFTTIGILLALWINNWDESRKKRAIEKETLLEIKAGLEQDRRDLEETIFGYSSRVENVENIFKYLGRDAIPPDSIAWAMSDLIGYSFLLANTAGYETLKSRGLETITNDSIRLAISTLYDVDYEAIQVSEKFLGELHTGLVMPYLLTHLRLGVQEYSDQEIKSLVADRPFQQMLWQVGLFNNTVKKRYEHALKNLENLMAKIELELNSGRF